jgi:acyl carrier protein
MTDEATITKILADFTERDAQSFAPESRVKDLGIDSFNLLKLMIQLEVAFGVEISGSQIETIANGNVGSIASTLNAIRMANA